MRRIIGIGETVLDVIFHDDQPKVAVPGGSTFNALVSLGRTIGVEYPSIPISMITEVGDDHIGDIVVDFMQKNHIDTTHVIRNQGTQTHISMAFLDHNNDAQYEFYKDHAHASLKQEKLNSFPFQANDIVIFGSFFAINPVIRKVTSSLLQQAHSAGAILYYDINFRKSHIKDLPDVMDSIQENCELSDIVRGSSDDFQYLFGTTNAEEIYQNHIQHLCQNFIFTSGPEKIEVFSSDSHSVYHPMRCNTVSTIGAGDNFNAGIIYALVHHGIIKENSLKTLTINTSSWDLFVEKARYFSAAVCQSLNNYVDEDFIETIKNNGLPE